MTDVDEASWVELYRALEKPLYNVVYRWLWDSAESHDVVQEAFLRCWRRRELVRADLENARVTLNRTRSLVEQGVLSKQALDDAQARYDSQVARFASYEKTNALVRIGPRREDIDAMRAQVKQAEGTLAFAQTQLDNTVISAPISGAILERNVERGEFVTTGFVSDRGAKGYVVSMADLTDLQVELDINQNDFAKLGPRQPAVILTAGEPAAQLRRNMYPAQASQQQLVDAVSTGCR